MKGAQRKRDCSGYRHEASRCFRNKKREYLKARMNELPKNCKNKNVRDLYRGITDFKRGYQCRSKLVKDENGGLLADAIVKEPLVSVNARTWGQ
jgi:hypothetical protein